MIIVGRDGALLVFALVLLAMFVVLPVLFLRSARRLVEVPQGAG